MKALIGIGLCAALLGGCAALPGLAPGRDGQRECAQQLGQEQELQMNMVRDMIREGRLHAALANLESMPPTLLDVREEKALILRRIGDPRARAEYQALLETCKAPEAHHGLGLLALRNGDSTRAVLELREAARLRPTESRFRNDLGVALLKRGDRVGARFEFITALELQQGGKLPATNLLGLLYLQGEREDAQRLIERLQLDARDIRAAEARARSWGAAATPGAAPASDDPLAELPAEAGMHTAMANETP
ncbi:type 4b pilus Flp biogenesis protein TadD [Pseudomonas aeruginosa]|uniref:type 4b pilus Flp biogenesis protein TadD n=2 Tax=Pseudomonas aeruginosa TaxID=287 RepID=UPI00300240BA|nr:type 4b pilus Flp biogenesis protein TadD [Pseudomonas aeruginosa]